MCTAFLDVYFPDRIAVMVLIFNSFLEPAAVCIELSRV